MKWSPFCQSAWRGLFTLLPCHFPARPQSKLRDQHCDNYLAQHPQPYYIQLHSPKQRYNPAKIYRRRTGFIHIPSASLRAPAAPMEDTNLSVASTYINNLLLSRGLLKNGSNIDFAHPERGDGGTDGTMAKVMGLVNDLILRRDVRLPYYTPRRKALQTCCAQ